MDSILGSIKKILGIPYEVCDFDLDITMAINTAFSILNQIGVGPKTGFSIRDANDLWEDYMVYPDDQNLEMLKNYIGMRVRLIFDPPATSFAVDALKTQIQEFEWRMNVQADQ